MSGSVTETIANLPAVTLLQANDVLPIQQVVDGVTRSVMVSQLGGNAVPATTSTLGVVKIGTGLSVAGDGTLTATGGSTPTAPAAFVLAGPVSGSPAAAAARALVGSDLPLATTSVPGAVIFGGANGAARLDSAGTASANTLIPTASGASAISLGDYTANLALAGNAYLINPLASNQAYAGVSVAMSQVPDTTLITNIQALLGGTGNAAITNFAHGVGTGSITGGTRNLFSGFGAGNGMGIGQYSPENTFQGFGSGNSFGSVAGGTSGYNTFHGSKSGFNMIYGQFNVLNGQGAGSALQNAAVANVCVGHGTMSGYDYGVVNPATGILNTGYVAANNATGNTFTGTYAGQTATSAAYNFGGGYGAGQFLTSGAYNAFSGAYAGNYIVTGQYNVANGAFALAYAGNTVSNVIAVGHGTLFNVQTNNHVVVGNQGAQSATTLQRLVGVGYQIAQNLIDGNDILALGWNTGANLVHGAQSVYIGSSVGDLAVFSGVGYISDGGGVNAGTILTITSVGTKNNGYNVGDYITGIGVTTCTITAVLTGTNGVGTYQLSGAAQLVPAGTNINNRDYSNTIAIGYNIEPTASNQVFIGNGSISTFIVGGAPGGLVNIGPGYIALGNQSLASITSTLSKVTAIGASSAQYATAVTSSVFFGDNNAWNFVAGTQNIIIGVGSASNGAVYKGTISGTTLTVTSRLNSANLITVGPIYINGVKVANITAQTSGTTGTTGTYTIDTSLTYATTTLMASADYSNVTLVGSSIVPTASNQAIYGNGATTSFSVGGPPGVGMMYLNSGFQLGIGTGSLAAATLSPTTIQHVQAVGYNALKSLTTGDFTVGMGHGVLGALTVNGNCAVVGYLGYANATGGGHAGLGANVGAGIFASTGTVIIGNGAQATGDFSQIVVLGSGASATAAGQIVIGYGITAESTSTGVTIGGASQSVSIGGAFTIAGGATGAALFGGTVSATGGFAGAHNGTVGATTPNTGAFTTLTATLASTFSSTVKASAFLVGTNQVVGARITGWGTSTAGTRGAINGSSATLAQTSAALAQLLIDLETHGLIST